MMRFSHTRKTNKYNLILTVFLCSTTLDARQSKGAAHMWASPSFHFMLTRFSGKEASMNLKDMKYFLTVCDRKSITSAADFLYISPQALSKDMQKLEKEIGAPLLIRSNNGVHVTPYGEIFYSCAQKMLEDYTDMQTEIQSLVSQNHGILKMASAFGILRYLTPEFVNTFTEQNPDIHLEYMEFPDLYVSDNVKNGNCDIGLVPYITKDDDFVYTDLFHLEICFITHVGSRFYGRSEVSLTEAIEEPFIVENKNFILRHILTETCRQKHIRPDIYFNTSGFSLCYKLCREGKGNTLSMPFIYDDMKAGRLRMIPFQEHLMWNIALIYKKNTILSPNLKKLIQHIINWTVSLPDS